MASCRVLIVDDKSQVRRELRTVLSIAGRIAGLQVEIVGEAQDGKEAVQQVGVLHPDVVLMDLEMPGMDGYSATQEIKALDASIRVIALTIHAHPTAREKAAEVSVDDYIVKGAPVEAILKSIQIKERKEN